MTPDDAEWVRTRVLDAYLDDGANRAHHWCRPVRPADGCQRNRPATHLRAPRTCGPPDPRGEARPQLYHPVWLAPAARHHQDAEPAQLGLFSEVA
jgi:hypothetical protein